MRITKRAVITGAAFASRICEAMGVEPANVSRLEIVVDGHSSNGPLVIQFDMVTRNEQLLDILADDLEPLDDGTTPQP